MFPVRHPSAYMGIDIGPFPNSHVMMIKRLLRCAKRLIHVQPLAARIQMQKMWNIMEYPRKVVPPH